MSNITYFTVESVIRQIEDASYDSGQCWKFALKGADVLFENKQRSVDELIQLLSHGDTKVVALSILYLGILNKMGLNTTKATKPIRRTASVGPEVLEFSAGLALAMIGDPTARQAMMTHMKQARIDTAHEWERRGIATVVEYVATGIW